MIAPRVQALPSEIVLFHNSCRKLSSFRQAQALGIEFASRATKPHFVFHGDDGRSCVAVGRLAPEL